MVNGLVTEVAREVALNIGPWISGTSHVYTVGPDTPTVRVQLDDPTLAWRASLQTAFAAVPIPAGAVPEAGSDSEMSIWQPSTDKLWEFFEMRLLPDGWHAAWGGAIQNVSQSPGYYTSDSWPGAASNWGATATSLPHAAGVITQADLQQGEIDHALAVDLPYPRAGVWAWPAQRADGTGTDPNAIPEGAHLRLDPNLNLAALHLPPLVYMMAKAAQKYGMIVRDQTHWAIGFFIEDPTITGGAPYWVNGTVSKTGLFQGKLPSQLMSQFPWSSVQVLKMALSGPGAH